MPSPSSPQWSYCLNSGWRDSVKKNRLIHVWHTESKVSFQRCTLFKFFFGECFSIRLFHFLATCLVPSSACFFVCLLVFFYCFLRYITIIRLSLMVAAIRGPLMCWLIWEQGMIKLPSLSFSWSCSLEAEKMLCKWFVNPFTLFVPFLPFVFTLNF